MGVGLLRDGTFSIEDDAMEDGMRWRAVCRDRYGKILDATRWVTSPARAVRDEQRLITGTYWADGGDPHADWVRAA
jgi:CelD/BcsL family acetyltransferase involved in cellulose biosynthesis